MKIGNCSLAVTIANASDGACGMLSNCAGYYCLVPRCYYLWVAILPVSHVTRCSHGLWHHLVAALPAHSMKHFIALQISHSSFMLPANHGAD